MTKILIIDTYYEKYIQELYTVKDKYLSLRPWTDQYSKHFEENFGTSDAYSYNLRKKGIECIEIIANSTILQQRWHTEFGKNHNSTFNPFNTLLEQIKWVKADIVYVQDINWVPSAFVKHLKSEGLVVIGQNACPLQKNIDVSGYDLILSSLPNYVEMFGRMGARSKLLKIGFDERILNKIVINNSRSKPLTFVGGITSSHKKGVELINQICESFDMHIWGYKEKESGMSYKASKRWMGEAWGEKMYKILADSKITLNRHINIAENYANNMRLFEATGMGACLLTDEKCNLHEYFEPNYEVVTYSCTRDAIGKIQYLTENPLECRKIAKRGQQRTIRDHKYKDRIDDLTLIIKDLLKTIK